jgi:hypothetical protein
MRTPALAFSARRGRVDNAAESKEFFKSGWPGAAQKRPRNFA